MSINETVSIYLAAKAEEAAAKKRADAAKKEILAHAGNLDTFTTDAWTVIVKRTVSVRLDTKKLYEEFGEQATKELYGRESVSVSIDAVPAAAAAGKTA